MIHQRAFALGLLSTTALAAVSPAIAQSLPTGANVAYGSVGFQRSSGSLTINQSSQNAIVNYGSFSIGRGNSVTFNQPNSSSVILNRVTGNTSSTIAGHLNANGQVYLVNPNGIAITKTGVVKVGGGFVASSLDMSDEEFKSGRHKFKGTGASANVSNAGAVRIGRGGYAALIGGSVTNSGMIAVPMGKVGLGSGEAATLDVSGDGFLQVAVPTASAGKAALIQNSGTISAAGGTVVLDAATARAAARNAVNISGTIDAHSISGRSGAIYIGGGAGGAVQVSGRLRVASASGHSGSVTITGRKISLRHAVVEASGATGGGTVKIGGDLHGGGTLAHADSVTIDAKSVVTADATGHGTGGNVVVWSDETTSFAGLISAKGGAQSGDGGNVEVSSHGVLDYTGLTKLTAANGTAGTLLLDPYDVVISSGSDTNGSFDGGSPTSTYTATGTSVISVGTLQTQLANGNVTITTAGSGSDAGNITIAAPVTWSSGSLLTLTANNAIAVNANISITGAGQLALNTGTTTTGGITQPLLSFAQGASIDYGATNNAGTLSINSHNYALVYSMTALAGIGTSSSSSSYFALATDLTSTTSYTAAVVRAGYYGTFEGLGHTISNLTINDTSTDLVGLFRSIPQGTIRDIGLVGGSISATGSQSYVGALVGFTGQSHSPTSVVNVWSTATVTGGDQSNAGGLIGEAYVYSGAPVLVANSYSTGNVTTGASGYGGGLVGQQTAYYNSGANAATITGSHATGTVTGGSYATLGGLVGAFSAYDNSSTAILNSYATGAVNGSTGSVAGGLVGSNFTLSGVSSISGSFATGAVTGGSASTNGGLVGSNSGENDGSGGGVASITDSFATGVVTGGGGATMTGGLVGLNLGYGALASITTSYATGRVTNGGYSGTGGLIGENESMGNGGSTSVTSSYYDTGTTGQSDANGGSVGLTTAQLQGGLPTGFSSSSWGTGAGLYPYLSRIFSGGVQAVSGIAYTDAGTTAAASGANGAVTVSLDANGGLAAQATTGANGYYYIVLPNGTLANGGALLVSTPANGSTGATNSATLTTSAGATAQGNVNLYGNTATVVTSATLLSAVPTPAAAAGTDSAAAAVVGATTGLDYIATGASFTIDQSVDLSTSFGVATVASGASITVAKAITMESGGALGLWAAGALTVNAPITAKGAVSVALAYDQNTTAASVTDLSFGLTASGFTGGLTYTDASGGSLAGTTGAGGTLSVNGQAYTLLYVLASPNSTGPDSGTNDIAGIDAAGDAGYYAVATNVDGTGTTFTSAPVGAGGDEFGHRGNEFTGTFEGLGHTVSNLTISETGGYNVGLFGTNSGTIRDIGVVGGSVASIGSGDAGDLVGWNAYSNQGGSPTIVNTYATGAVSGTTATGGLVGFNQSIFPALPIINAFATGAVAGGFATGGLVGYDQGTLTNVYATGAVSNSGSFTDLGGLVGLQTGGAITDASATGAVTASGYDPYVGGLVGSLRSSATITDAYATGAVIASGNTPILGGLVADLQSGTITSSFYDSQTTGQSSSEATGVTTRQLQGLDPLPDSGTITDANHLGTVFAGGTGGLYPYLSSFFPNGLQAISGTAYTTAGTTPVSGATVGVIAGGQSVGTATTSANGYYYAIVPNGTIDTVNGTSVVAFMQANAGTGIQNSATLAIKAFGTVSGLNVDSGWLIETADASIGSVSALDSVYATAVGSSAAANLTFADRQITTAAANFAIDQAQTETGTLALSSNGTVTQSAAIAAGKLLLGGTGSYTLTGTGNTIGTVAANASSLALVDTSALTIGSVSDASGTATAGVTTTTTASLATTSDLTIASGAALAGTDVTLAATGAFVNNAGSEAISASDGWLVYSANSAGDTFDGLDSTNTAIWNTAAGGSVSATGNRYVFAEQPVLTVTTENATKTYGADATGAVANDYTITGVRAGVSGAYLGDTASLVYSGTATVASLGSATTAGVHAGGYAYTLGQGTVTAALGYTVALANTGTLTVTPAALTITAGAESRSYGDANPALSYTIGGSGLFNGDALTGALTTSAMASSNVGTYAIGKGSLAASANYTLTYVGRNLTIAKRAVTVTATAETKTYGNANPTLAYTTTSLGSGAALTGVLATTATATSNVGSYGITAGTLTAAANPNYAVTYVGNNLTIGKRAITVTATAETKTYGNANPTLAYTTTSLGSGAALTGVLATTATATSNVGSYGITAGTLTAAANPNYAVTYVGNNLTIGKRAITVTATAETKTYGNANPTLAYTTTSLGSGAALTGVLATTASPTSNVGAYGITAGTLTAAANPNYAVTYKGANLTITQAALTITADSLTKTYGANVTLGTSAFKEVGLRNGDTISAVTLTSLGAAAIATVTGGPYAITASAAKGAHVGDYAIKYVGGTLTVKPASITVTARGGTSVFGTSPANPGLSATGLQNGQGVSVLTGLTNSFGITKTSAVKSYSVTVLGNLTNANYAIAGRKTGTWAVTSAKGS